MSQRSISSFFKPVNREIQVKEVAAENVKIMNGNKRMKISSKENIDGVTEENSECEALSPSQKQTIENNKLKAQVKLQCKMTPALHQSIDVTWFEALKEEFSKPYFEELSSFLSTERKSYTVYPPTNQVFSWTNFCQLKQVRVVILGQDPYHGIGQAHGLCFSVQRGVAPPPSLVNMYKELETDIAGFKHPGHGYLVGWAKQGVLLLNACLTVRANKANSHKDKGWESFTDAVIKTVSTCNSNVVFLLWGSYAQKKAAVVDKDRHHLLNAPHPSPLSAHRGFFGCRHFSKCNDLLVKNGHQPINWADLSLDD